MSEVLVDQNVGGSELVDETTIQALSAQVIAAANRILDESPAPELEQQAGE